MPDKNDRIEELTAMVEAAEKLCCIYFEIASSAMGDDEVRKRRDDIIRFQVKYPSVRMNRKG